MPKVKKTTVTEEEVVETPQEYKDIHDNSIRDIVKGDDTNEQITRSEEQEKEETKQEKVEPVKEDEGVDFDPVAFEKSVSSRVTKTIVDSLQGKSEGEQKKTVDEWEDFAKNTWEKAGRNPTYKEALQFVKEQTKKEIFDEQKKAADDQLAKQKQQEDFQKNQEQQINAFVAKELNELYEDKKLPRIKDINDPKDPGKIARDALLQQMVQINTKLLQEGKPPEYSIYKIYTKYYKAPNQQPAGADAPVSMGGNKTGNPEEENQINYFRDIKKKSFWQIFRGQ